MINCYVKNDRLNFVVKKEDPEYNQILQFVELFDRDKTLIWYGDVCDENEKETSGLIISLK